MSREQELLADLRELEGLYNTDGIAHMTAAQIERIFDKWLHSDPPAASLGRDGAPQDDRGELTRLRALRLTIKQLEGARPDDPSSPFIGEEVISRSDVLGAIDLFAKQVATLREGRASQDETWIKRMNTVLAAIDAALDDGPRPATKGRLENARRHVANFIREPIDFTAAEVREGRADAPPAQKSNMEEPMTEAPTSLVDAAEMLWVVLANVSGGDWIQQTPEWQDAAARWRDNYFAALKANGAPPAVVLPGGEK